jgi:hypothetical protein
MTYIKVILLALAISNRVLPIRNSMIINKKWRGRKGKIEGRA